MIITKLFSLLPAAALLIGASPVAAATNSIVDGCLTYDKPVTLTGTVLVRKLKYKDINDAPPEGSRPFPLLVVDQMICMGPSPDEESESENMEWALQIADKCARVWPAAARVKITGMLYHAHNWHHHSKVLILVNQIERLDGQLPSCNSK